MVILPMSRIDKPKFTGLLIFTFALSISTDRNFSGQHLMCDSWTLPLDNFFFYQLPQVFVIPHILHSFSEHRLFKQLEKVLLKIIFGVYS